MAREFDVVLSGGRVIDGTGRPAYIADVGVKDGKIAQIGSLQGAPATETIPAGGAVVCPGFIDMHNHADGTILSYPRAESFIMQGTTTVLAGHCGFSPAPLLDRYLLSFWEFRFWPDIEPYMFHEPLIHPLDKVRKAAAERIGLDISWHSFGEWLDRLEETRISLNLIPLVGHNTIRAQVMGNEAREPSEAELAQMKDLLCRSMEEGAVGFSSGVDYQPGAYAKTPELVELARAAHAYGGLHSMHWLRTGIRRADVKRSGPPNKLAGIQQAVDISRQSQIKLLISHIVSGFSIYPEGSEALERAAALATLEIIDKANAGGLDVAFDVIPNTDGGVLLGSYLIGLLVPWARAAGSLEALSRALRIADYRAVIRDYLEAGKWYGFQPKADPAWAGRITIAQAEHEDWCGKSIAAIAAEDESGDALETLFDMVEAEPMARIRVQGFMSTAGKQAFCAHPRGMMGSDTFAFDDTWQVEHPPFLLPHPNTYSAVPWYLECYAPGNLEEKIRRLTGLPASWLGLHDRGSVEQGKWADLVVFSPENYKARGDYLEPRRYPSGLSHVLVNGKVVVKDGVHLGVRPGAVIRRK